MLLFCKENSEKKELKKALEMYDLEFILYFNLQDTIVRIKASCLRWKFLL